LVACSGARFPGPMIALARKYRPKRFADLVEQEHVAAALRGAVAKGRVGHGYLLTGPRGVGKTTAARILAMALNCERGDPTSRGGEPCGECQTCERTWSGLAGLDVVEIDAASNRSVDDARELRERAMYAASDEQRYKVYIVDEAHMLTREAWNALLKILEEPPPRVVFVFATTEPQKIANTAAPVLSRLQRFDFKRIGAGPIRQRLSAVLKAEGYSADEDALALIARYADGGMRDGLSVLDQVLSLGDGTLSAERVRQALGLLDEESYVEAITAVADRAPERIFPLIDRVVASGADLVEFVAGLGELLRAVLMAGTGVEAEGLTAETKRAVGVLKDRLPPADALRMLTLLADAETSIRRSANGRLVVETLLLRWALMDRTVDLEEVLRGAGPASPPGRSSGRAGRPSSRAAEEPAPPARSAAPIVETLSVEGLTDAWPDVVARGRQQSPLLGTVLEALAPTEVQKGRVVLGVAPGHDHVAEGASRQQKAIEALLSEAVGKPVVIELRSAGQAEAEPKRPKRMSDKDLKAERLVELRREDPALDAAADALDLEIAE